MLPPQIKDPLKLCPCVRKRYESLRVKSIEMDLPLTLIETLRDMQRQVHYVNIGVSKTLLSKHLPQPPHNLSLAFDIVPTSLLTEPGWDGSSPLWGRMGLLGQSSGLLWGFRLWGWDKPHFHLPKCECT